MAKLTLDLEQIRVDSFAPADEVARDGEGTVRGFAASAPLRTCANPSCLIASCGATCPITCGVCTY